VHSFNDIHYPLLFLGIIAAGGVFTGTNPGYTQYELAHHFKTAKVRFLISEPEILSNLQAAAKGCNIAQENLWIFHPLPEQKCPEGSKSWQELLSHGENDWIRFNDLKTCSTTTAARMFSSGTTGLPKAACVTHYNFIAQHELVYEGPNKKPYDVSKSFQKWGLVPYMNIETNRSMAGRPSISIALLPCFHCPTGSYRCSQGGVEDICHASVRARAVLRV
jgi:acyl-CoA synthetase (AMP-forming)/AMP-acid ligase II